MTTLVAGQDLEALRIWANALPAYVENGVVCDELTPGLARLRMPVPPHFRNPSGATNGGALAFFVDQMGGLVASTMVSAEHGPVTASLTLNYLAPAVGDELTGHGRIERAGRSLAFVALEAYSADRLCVTGSGVWLLGSPRGPVSA